MTLDEFRKKHSELIEHYQFIEHHLEGIYAGLEDGKGFCSGLQDVEKDNIPRLIQKNKALQKKKNEIVLPDSDYTRLVKICERRNFWCHNCYVDLSFDAWSGDLKKQTDVKKMTDDYVEESI